MVGFEDAGGSEELLREGAGALAPFEDTATYAQRIRTLLADRGTAASLGARGREIVSERFGWTRFVLDLAHMAGLPGPRVSVIVPNFNYRRYLPERLESIAAQTWPIYELIVLDDASTDGSREWLEQEARRRFPEARLVFNDTNSGGAFQQWRKGVQLATGDMVWIAEAYDLAAPDSLRTTVGAFDDPETVLSYCQSRQMRADGNISGADYLAYVADLSAELSDYVADGADEIARHLAVTEHHPQRQRGAVPAGAAGRGLDGALRPHRAAPGRHPPNEYPILTRNRQRVNRNLSERPRTRPKYSWAVLNTGERQRTAGVVPAEPRPAIR